MRDAPTASTMSGEAVKVVVRSRPFNSKEIAEERTNIVEMNIPLNQVCIRNPKEEDEPKRFTFDAVYDDQSTQRAVYDETGYPLVEAVLQGYNGTMFAYGQVRGPQSCLKVGSEHTMGRSWLLKKGPSCFSHVGSAALAWPCPHCVATPVRATCALALY